MNIERLILAFISLVACSIIWAGLAWPLGYRQFQIWPWSKSWFMFSYSSNYVQKLSARGTLADDSIVEIDLEQWFRYPASPLSRRYDEMSKSAYVIKNFAHYICQHYEGPLKAVSIYNYWWYTEAGKRTDMSQKIENQKQILLENESCSRGQL